MQYKHLIFHGIFLFSVTVELTVTKKFGIKWPELGSSHAWCLFYNKETFCTKSQFTTQHFPKPPSLFHFYANPSSGVGLDLDTGWRLHNAVMTLGLI